MARQRRTCDLGFPRWKPKSRAVALQITPLTTKHTSKIMSTRYFVTGGAGFIGSNLVDRLLGLGDAVTVYDNLSTGQHRFLDPAKKKKAFRLIEGDLLDEAKLADAVKGHDFVFHLAANADVRFGTDHPRRDLEQNTIVTYNVLIHAAVQAMQSALVALKADDMSKAPPLASFDEVTRLVGLNDYMKLEQHYKAN